MGEIILALDPICTRQVAIKRIRPELQKHTVIKNRFLREAEITARLTHPGIISIYSIEYEEGAMYYTMPYVEGETLRQIVRAGQQEMRSPKKEGHKPASIPSLLPIFKSICQTISYAHSKGILHRDLKPENILVGKFGEVIVLDWGLALPIGEPSIPSDLCEGISFETSSDLTSPGKLIGTVAFMAPERALSAEATIQTDVYALGVILYQILTLHLPFHRTSIKEFCKSYKYEKLLDPEEVAPYRDVPPALSRIVKKCLSVDPKNRYQTVDELIHILMSYMEGRSDWFEIAKLDVNVKSHWEFQENVMISKHIAITRTTEASNWVSIMVSRESFAENTRIDTRVWIGKKGAGIGLLLSVPEILQRENPLEGYCLWLSSEEIPSSQLFRNTVEVMHLPDLYLEKERWHSITIEKIDNHIRFTFNGSQYFNYISYLPLFGTHIGVLAHDADFQLDTITVSVGSQNLQVSCLSIPDAFLANKDYDRALVEYRRIGHAFPGHAEGREALFRAGITLLEEARHARDPQKTRNFYTLAIEEFGKLHHTPGAPLEYLGKAIVYQSLSDHAEEIKCLELGLRRYWLHPLVSAIQEQILYRMHEASQTDRRSAYQFILIALRLLPEVMTNEDSLRLFKHLVTHWELLPFLESSIDASLLDKEIICKIRFGISLAFWIASPYILQEIFREMISLKVYDIPAIGDIIYCLFELGSYRIGESLMDEASSIKTELSYEDGIELREVLLLFDPIIICHQKTLREAQENFFETKRVDMGAKEFRTILHLMQEGLRSNLNDEVLLIAEKIIDLPLSFQDRIQLDACRIWAYLKKDSPEDAEKVFANYHMEMLNQESTILHSLYGCYLYITEGEEIATIHFAGVIDTPFPRSWALLSHELSNHITDSSWYQTSFLWERRQLYRQLTLYYHCAKQPELVAQYEKLESQEYINPLE